MGRDEDNPVVGKLRQQIAETDPFAGVKPAGRFVQNQNLRVVQHGLRDSHPAFHAAGKTGNLFVRNV